ncbi:hypothetical protein [Lacticaseibacillus casei]|uniref:hypothetical protein n=1 Tax=Lacticaseibacillus casei TaxID=1582 RepID=UPI0014868711|nr:hypothetical protein [Lacticaseibacillus casei]
MKEQFQFLMKSLAIYQKKIQAKMYAYLKNLSGKTIIIIDHNAPKVTGATYWEL